MQSASALNLFDQLPTIIARDKDMPANILQHSICVLPLW